MSSYAMKTIRQMRQGRPASVKQILLYALIFGICGGSLGFASFTAANEIYACQPLASQKQVAWQQGKMP